MNFPTPRLASDINFSAMMLFRFPLVTLVLFTAISHLRAQEYLALDTIFGPTYEVIDLASADLDGDGLEDLVASRGSYSSELTILYQEDGMFEAERIDFPSSHDILNFDLVDLDGDGDLDVFSTTPDDVIYILENLGDRKHTLLVYDTPDMMGAVGQPRDVDGDGNVDIILWSIVDSEVYWLRNSGGMNFDAAELLVNNEGSSELYFGDFNADGRVDILEFTTQESFDVRLQRDLLEFELVQTGNLGYYTYGAKQLEDLNGDGLQDLVISGDFITYYPGRADGSFSEDELTALSYGYYSPEGPYFLDYNGDDVIDIVMQAEDLLFFEGLGSGDYSENPLIYPGYSDVLTIGYSDLRDETYLFSKRTDLAGIAYAQDIMDTDIKSLELVMDYLGIFDALRTGDVDGDGFDEIFFPDINSVVVESVENQWNSRQILVEDLYSLLYGLYDLNGDGRDDYFFEQGQVRAAYSDVDGCFTASEEISVFLDEDLPGDAIHFVNKSAEGDQIEMIYVDFESRILSAARDINGRFSDPSQVGGISTLRPSLDGYDIDKDELMDFLYVDSSDQCISVLLNKGSSPWIVEELLCLESQVVDFVIGDVNADGRNELITITADRAELWSIEDAEVGFESVRTIPLDDIGDGVLFDLDRDGILDIMFGAREGLFVSFLEPDLRAFEPILLIETRDPFNLALGQFGEEESLLIEYLDDAAVYAINGLSGRARNRVICSSFIDYNSNGVLDGEEFLLTNQSFRVVEDGTAYSTGSQDRALILTGPGTYSIVYAGSALDSFVNAVSDTVRLTFDSTAGNEFVQFPLEVDGEFERIELDLELPRPRCNSLVAATATWSNLGSESFVGFAGLLLDDRLSFTRANPRADTMINGELIWTVNDLKSLQNFSVQLILDMPSEMSVGDTLYNVLSAWTGEFSEQEEIISEDVFDDIVLCAYDPNDKLVQPFAGEAESNLTLRDEMLEYTIRFQNTGNDTAFTVRLTDQLSPWLDPSSMRVISSSHDYSYTLSSSDVITFLFEDIKLVDSFTNEPLSHGFVKFEVEYSDTIPHGTSILNTANIYFDRNPAIVTNTVESIIVDSLPTSVHLLERAEISMSISPVPARSQISVEIGSSDVLPDDAILRIYDLQGREVSSLRWNAAISMPVDITFLPNGIYLLQLSSAKTGKRMAGARFVVME